MKQKRIVQNSYHCTMTIQEAYQQLLLQLYKLYEDNEAANIADMVIEFVTGQRKTDRVANKEFSVASPQLKQLEKITNELLQHTPVQYVLHEAWFAGMKLYVDENVLIPRPETEELVAWILDDVKKNAIEPKSVLDIGTGSGCIAIALKKNLPKAIVRAVDISEGAINVAIKNAMLQAAQVYFIRMNFLDHETTQQTGRFNIIVSNPPYIKQSEAGEMHTNVLAHEPHLALFVPDEDALLFYRHIAAFGKTHLENNGAIYVEINEAHGPAVLSLFTNEGYKTECRKDMQGKDRMIKAVK